MSPVYSVRALSGLYPAVPNPRMQPTGRDGRTSLRARGSQWPSSGGIGLCGRRHEGLQLMRKSLDSRTRIRLDRP